MRLIFILACSIMLQACSQQTETSTSNYQVNKTDQEWKNLLSEEEYRIIRKKGTERAFTHPYNEIKSKKGVFHCKACNYPLFLANTKFNSGTGWPSFYDEIDNHVEEITDNSYGMTRTEVVCANCGGHLGHVFPDGPKPTGLRYCINGASLSYEEK